MWPVKLAVIVFVWPMMSMIQLGSGPITDHPGRIIDAIENRAGVRKAILIEYQAEVLAIEQQGDGTVRRLIEHSRVRMAWNNPELHLVRESHVVDQADTAEGRLDISEISTVSKSAMIGISWHGSSVRDPSSAPSARDLPYAKRYLSEEQFGVEDEFKAPAITLLAKSSQEISDWYMRQCPLTLLAGLSPLDGTGLEVVLKESAACVVTEVRWRDYDAVKLSCDQPLGRHEVTAVPALGYLLVEIRAVSNPDKSVKQTGESAGSQVEITHRLKEWEGTESGAVFEWESVFSHGDGKEAEISGELRVTEFGPAPRGADFEILAKVPDGTRVYNQSAPQIPMQFVSGNVESTAGDSVREHLAEMDRKPPRMISPSGLQGGAWLAWTGTGLFVIVVLIWYARSNRI